MDVYDFLNTFTDLSAVVLSIFDCDSEEIVWNSAEHDSGNKIFDIQDAGLDGFDVEGVDLWIDGANRIHMELNISMGED